MTRVIRLFPVWAAVALTATLSVAACAQSRPETLTDIAEPITDPGWLRFRANANVDPATFFDRYSRLLELSPDTRMRLVSTSPDAGADVIAPLALQQRSHHWRSSIESRSIRKSCAAGR